MSTTAVGRRIVLAYEPKLLTYFVHANTRSHHRRITPNDEVKIGLKEQQATESMGSVTTGLFS
jgi:hypothetical protein